MGADTPLSFCIIRAPHARQPPVGLKLLVGVILRGAACERGIRVGGGSGSGVRPPAHHQGLQAEGAERCNVGKKWIGLKGMRMTKFGPGCGELDSFTTVRTRLPGSVTVDAPADAH